LSQNWPANLSFSPFQQQLKKASLNNLNKKCSPGLNETQKSGFKNPHKWIFITPWKKIGLFSARIGL